MEFCEKSFFCIDLRKGSLSMSIGIMLLCMVNNSFSLWNLIYSKEVPVSKYMLLVTDTSIFCFVYCIWAHLKKKRTYTWHISLYMFIIVLCQIIEVVIMLAETLTSQFYVYELLISLALSGFLCYYLMIVMSYFYSISVEGRFDPVPQKLMDPTIKS